MELGRLQETLELFNEAVKAAPDDLDIARNEVEIGVWTQNPLGIQFPMKCNQLIVITK